MTKEADLPIFHVICHWRSISFGASVLLSFLCLVVCFKCV